MIAGVDVFFWLANHLPALAAVLAALILALLFLVHWLWCEAWRRGFNSGTERGWLEGVRWATEKGEGGPR